MATDDKVVIGLTHGSDDPEAVLIGYLLGSATGAMFYNAAHMYGVGAVLVVAGLAGAPAWLVPVGLIWIAHVALDQALGFGIKLLAGFNETHLGPIGRPA